MKQTITYLLTTICCLTVLLCHAQNKFYTSDGIPYFPVLDSAPSVDSTGGIYINSTDKTLYRYNGKKWVTFSTGSLKPSANKVTITTDATTSSIVPGDYNYVPDNYQTASEGTSTYQWYWAIDNLGTNKTAISGATESTYDVNVGEVYIAFGVTPISTGNTTGNEIISNWEKVAATDTAPDGTEVEDMASTSGRIWMDRNLGASQAADSLTDYNAYGSLFQWCRAADGHQLINWTNDTTGTAVNDTTSTLSTTISPRHSMFITTNSSSPYDWLSTQLSNGNPWWNGSSPGINNPCPTSYHVPTYTEWYNEEKIISDNGNNADAAYSLLRLPVTGWRSHSNGSLNNTGSYGYYWSSSVGDSHARSPHLRSSNAYTNYHPRANGFSIRCIKDQITDNDRPSATDVNFSGTDTIVGSLLTGTYTYIADASTGSAEGTSTYQWYYASDASGTERTIISDATSITDTIASPVVAGDYIALGVTPVASNGVKGKEVLSSWVELAATNAAPDGTKVVDMTSTSGRIWMDRNLGASQAADSLTDYNAYGSLFQWCRAADGHQLITWTSSTSGTAVNGTTSTLSSTTAPSHSKFIISTSSPYDWLSTQESDGSLWWDGSSVGANNPCPTGYHVPTKTEWSTEETIMSNNGNDADAAYSLLKLPMAGYRLFSSGLLYTTTTGSNGYYWSSTVYNSSAYFLDFTSSNAKISAVYRAYGFSLRCIKDE